MSSSASQIVLYDLPSRPPCKAWSLNPWKTRFLLNYKGLDYCTEWTEYPDLKPKLEKHLPPNKDGAAYTSPTVQLPDGTYIMDSRVIATELEKRHPKPHVYLDSHLLAKLEEIMPKIMLTLRGIVFPQVPLALLNEASHPHWYKTREARAGKPLDQLAQDEGGQKAWDNAKPHIDEVTALLKEDTSGPYFMGETVSYADFVWGGFLIFIQRIGIDEFQRLLKMAGANSDVHTKLLLALGPWSLRDDR